MDELAILLVTLLFKLLAFLFGGLFNLLGFLLRTIGLLPSKRVARAPVEPQQQRRVGAPVQSTAALTVPRGGTAAQKLLPWLAAILERASTASREQNDGRFSSAFEELARAARAAIDRLTREGDAAATAVARTAAMLEGMSEALAAMAAQRKDRELALLLGDADALAEATYGPLIEYARGEGLALGYTRAVTLMGDTDLFVLLGSNPARLAPVVLPRAWATEVAWWPALAHEIGHTFYRGLDGFDAELRRRFALPVGGALPVGQQLTDLGLRSAVGGWLEELFADAAGVMMLGPAYVRTMIWNFAAPQQKARVLACGPVVRENRLDEHPPPHLRVVLACRLLAEMGYPTDGRTLEREWRGVHGGGLDRFFLATRAGSWLQVDEESVLARCEPLVIALYEETFVSLAGEPLRSIPGLDFGPREHQAAIDVAAELLGRSRLGTRDPRVLIAGAVLAWAERPAAAAEILLAARSHIPAVGASLRVLRMRAEADDDLVTAQEQGDDSEIYVEALLLGAILEPPVALRHRRRG